jgi:hypothetical protein
LSQMTDFKSHLLKPKPRTMKWTNHKDRIAFVPLGFKTVDVDPANVTMAINFREKKYARGGGVRKVRY